MFLLFLIMNSNLNILIRETLLSTFYLKLKLKLKKAEVITRITNKTIKKIFIIKKPVFQERVLEEEEGDLHLLEEE